MGFADDMSNLANKGISSVSRNAKLMELKAELRDYQNRRNAAYTDLGRSIVETLKDDDELIEIYPEQLSEIEDMNAHIKRKQEEIDALLKPPELRTIAIVSTCSACGNSLSEEAVFCMYCGNKVENNICSHCGNPLLPDAAFCTYCGAEINCDSEDE